MTSIDLILSLTQISAVETLSVVAGYWLLRRRPDMNIKKIDSMINILDPKYRSALLAGLRKAGVEEDE